MPRIIQDLPYTALITLAVPSTTAFPLAPGAGEPFVEPVDPDAADGLDAAVGPAGRIALVAIPSRDGLSTLLVVEHGDWSVACPLTSGQLHRLTNALAGRGTRTGIRPLSVDEEQVHLTGSPERLIVEASDRVVTIPAGPKRALSKALRAFEKEPPLS
ncbi:MAG: hypothetical protein JHD16_13675 [Solirubrobacteraceae bacterium]|nr:hypothetical protein [Solirubrobacteraceae bacterium]